MRNNDLILTKIEEGLKYIQDQNEKLDPVINYLTEQMINKKEELTAKEIFDYYIKLQELKVNSLLVESKLHEVFSYLH